MQGWIITKDHMVDEDHLVDSRVGWGQVSESTVIREANMVFGRQITVDNTLTKASIDNPVPFKLYDDDEELYYEGVISQSWIDGDECFAFAPLQFAEADAGCTIMKYKENGEWKHL